MIAIDTSALVAILFEEPEREVFTRINLERQSVVLSTPAALDFGDLFSYALAKVCGVPLLFKGDDFAQTDVDVVWRPSD